MEEKTSGKTYRIGEAAELLHLKTHVLRFWETEFSQLAPIRTDKGQRLYTEEHLSLLRRIQQLLHEQGMTIEGARRVLEGSAVLDENLPLGLLANTAAILGITLGKHMPEAVGADVLDGSGKAHLGIITFQGQILRGDAEQIRAIRETLYGVDYQDVIVVDFSDVAQCCKNYGEYIGKAAQADESEWRYFGLGLCGPKKLVSRLTGSMPLLR